MPTALLPVDRSPERCFPIAVIFWSTVLVALALWVPLSRAQQCEPVRGPRASAAPPPAPDETPAFSPKFGPEVHLQRAEGAVSIDGSLKEDGWCGATRITGFTEIQPGEQEPPQARTEVLLTYDASNLYLGFVAYDDPGAVRASLRNRDEIFSDDWVGVILDPYGDAAQAYEIFANPLGIQGDLLMASGSGEDVGFDLVYESEGQITENGYQVEMAIPFSSLRFPEHPVHEWNITFLRNHPRETRHLYSWAATDRDDPCLLCQLGTIAGIKDVKPSTKLDILPVVVGSQAGSLADEDNPAAGLDNGRVRIEPGLNMRYNFSPSLSAEATVNPDFSQVESDADQIDVNSTFALSFPERRPFFQEGSELFDTWIDAVYTRSINDPIAATKLTGRMGRTSVAYLGALDENTPLLLPFEERSAIAEAGRSYSNILRARRTFGESSFVGATITDRRLLDGGHGSLASADMKWQFLTNYRLEAQVALSNTQEPSGLAVSEENDTLRFSRGAHTAALDGEQFGGNGMFLSFDRNARHWSFDLAYQAYSPTFRTANGFVTGNDYRRVRLWQGVTFYPEWGVVERIQPQMFAKTEYNFAGEKREDYAQAHVFSQLTGQTHVFMSYGIGRERFHGVMFEDLSEWNVEVGSRFSDPLSVGFFLGGGRSIYRSDTPEPGRRRSFSAWATLKPLQRFVIEPSFRYSELRDLETGDAFFSGYILRSKLSFQFTRELSVRLVMQYNDFDEQFDLEPLVAYQINPFTVFYVGSTHNYGSFDDPNTSGWIQRERQFFFKFQYLFRI